VRARVVEDLTTARGVILAGQIIEIEDILFVRLRGKIEPISKTLEAELYQLIGETLREIDRKGRPWTGWRSKLSSEERQHLQKMENQIDDRYVSLDREGLLVALTEYRTDILLWRHAK